MEKLDVDTLRGRLSEAFLKPVIAEAQVWMGMGALWHLRKLGARKFVDVVSVETSLSLQRAELLVRCWEVARGKNRGLLQLCLDRPWEFVELVELVELVEGFPKSGLSKHLETVKYGDLAVAALLELRSKRRLEVLRSLGEGKR